MRRFLFLLVAIGSWAVPCATTAQPLNGYIGIYADSAGTQNTLSMSSGVPMRLYIVAILDGDSADGLLGAEFRVTGMPADWLVAATPNPLAVVALGDPFRAINETWRANLAFTSCQGTEDSTVVLYTVDVVPTSAVANQFLSVQAGDPPSNPHLDTPLVNLCDPPFYTALPVVGRTSVINPAGALPDLSVLDSDIRASDASPTPNQAISFEALVRNDGMIDPETSVAVRFLLDGLPLGNDVLVEPIPAGTSVPVVSPPWNTDFQPHVVTVQVDPDRQLAESSESNNEAQASLPYDLQVVSVPACNMFSPCDPCLGSDLTLFAEITYNGLFDVDSVAVEFRESTGEFSSSMTVGPFEAASNGSASIHASAIYPVTQLGSRRLEAMVDPDNLLQEFDESNNLLAHVLDVTCLPTAWYDYMVRSCDLVASDPGADVGQQILLMATVINIGDRDGPDSTTVRFALDGQTIGDDLPLAPIAAGDSAVVAIPWTVTFEPQQLTVLVDPEARLHELGLWNNQATAVLPYDFSVRINFEYADQGERCPGDLLEVSATVANAGLLSADSVLVEFNGITPAGPVGTTVIAHLPSKTYCAVPIPTPDYFVELEDGNTIVDAIVDPMDEWPEFDETNNTSTGNQSASCSDGGNGHVDLFVEAVEFSFEPFGTGVILGLTQVFASVGEADVQNVTCRLTIDGTAICDDVVLDLVLAPGYLYGFCYSTAVIPGDPDDVLVTACIDPDDLIQEWDEYNNCRDFPLGDDSVEVPVSLTDLEATSSVLGVTLRWQALDEPLQLAVERRAMPADPWHRLQTLTTRPQESNRYTTYEYMDRTASPGVTYEYRIVGMDTQGIERVLGTLAVRFLPPIPDRLVVEPPSPNPFNPTTRIRFSVPRRQHVDVRILSSSGRLVNQLWNTVVDAGVHDLVWAGDDVHGAKQPSGIYFCVIRAASGHEAHKLVLIK